ncbi:hypothetical protein GR183_16430 [Stappia sp. GBMRC 2046]|uniref:Hint domain-containing protein n=1 Tax=Stappia sediminis TaxID=2692190 RepID=A0A7X3LWT0_9HYPH|nr:calcium-binding protein [Stappia sediminis]MXN66503.1 hypothetical protein [Stappia sediminis]
MSEAKWDQLQSEIENLFLQSPEIVANPSLFYSRISIIAQNNDLVLSTSAFGGVGLGSSYASGRFIWDTAEGAGVKIDFRIPDTYAGGTFIIDFDGLEYFTQANIVGDFGPIGLSAGYSDDQFAVSASLSTLYAEVGINFAFTDVNSFLAGQFADDLTTGLSGRGIPVDGEIISRAQEGYKLALASNRDYDVFNYLAIEEFLSEGSDQNLYIHANATFDKVQVAQLNNNEFLITKTITTGAGEVRTSYERVTRDGVIQEVAGFRGIIDQNGTFIVQETYGNVPGAGQAQGGVESAELIDKIYKDVIQEDRDYCFSPDTDILLQDGSTKRIDMIVVGDRVAAYSSGNNEENWGVYGDIELADHLRLEARQVIDIIRNEAQKLIEVNGVKVTPGHKFYQPDGTFVEIGSLQIGDYLVAADGSPTKITSIKDVPGLHDTYNLTVEGLHTYIAGGYRVHNDSLFYPQSDEAILVDSIIDQVSAIVFQDNPFADIVVGSALRSLGSVVADSIFANEPLYGEIFLGRFAINVVGGIGGYAGRLLVEELGDELGLPAEATGALAIFANIAGSELAEYAALNFISETAPTGSTLQTEASEALAGSDPQIFLSGAAFAAIGSYAAQQLAELLGVEGEYGAFLTAPTRATITQISQNIIYNNNHPDNIIPWHTNVSAAALNSLGSVTGAFLANEIGQFDTYTEQLGSAIGSSIGSAIGSFLPIPIPFIGSFLGSLVGGLIGGAIGGLFGNDPVGYADLSFDTETDEFFISAVYGEDKNAEKIAKEIANSAEDALTSVLATINGDVLNEEVSDAIYGFEDGDFTFQRYGEKTNYGSNAEKLINTSVAELLAELEIAGGDVYAKRALSLSLERIDRGGTPDENPATVKSFYESIDTVLPSSVLTELGPGDIISIDDALDFLLNSLIVAKEYEKYLLNKDAINAQIAADPESEFAIGWQITLAQAFSLGLQRRHEADWNGGWSWWLEDKGVDASDVAFGYLEGERLIVTGSGEDAEFYGDTIAIGEKDTLSGTDGGDIIVVDHDRYGLSSISGQDGEFVSFDGIVPDTEILIGYSARLLGGAGHDLISGGNLGTELFGGAGNDKLVGGALDDWLFGGAGDDILLSGGGNGNLLDGGDDNDFILGGTGADWLIGGAGDDLLKGSAGDDILEGGVGRDRILGGEGNDTYIYRLGGGYDQLSDAGDDSADTLSFGEGIDAADVLVTASDNGNDVIVSFAGSTTDRILLKGVLSNGNNGIDRFTFDDGTVWNRSEILSHVDYSPVGGQTYSGTSGDEELIGTVGADILTGAGGTDTLDGGSGSDTYQFNRGDGADQIIDRGGLSDIDRVEFGPDIALTDLNFTRDQADPSILVISIAGTSDALTVATRSNGWGDGIEIFAFADGSTISLTDINQIYLGRNSSAADDTIIGFDTSEEISSGDGNDTLLGGKGNDLLDGGSGNDNYIFNLGDGKDVIVEDAGIDILNFGEGITPSDVHVSIAPHNSNTFVLSIPGTGDRVEIRNQFIGGALFAIDEVRFADGTVWSADDLRVRLLNNAATLGKDNVAATGGNDEISSEAGDDRLTGYGGDDTLNGGAGDDVLIGGDGNDTYLYSLGDGRDVLFDDYYSSNSYDDRLVFGAGITAQNIAVSRSTRDFDLRIGFSDGNWLTISDGASAYFSEGIETFVFDDGTELSQEELFDLLRADWTSEAKDDVLGFGTVDVISAGGGDDRLTGYGGDDTLNGGSGDDVLIGGDGSDTYHYGLGDGRDVLFDSYLSSNSYDDRLVFGAGITAQNIAVSRSTRDFDLRIGFSDGNWLTISDGASAYFSEGIETFVFDDGTELSQEELFDLLRADWTSEAKDDVLGFGTVDVISAGGGDDRLTGYGGDDTLNGGSGDDVLIGGDGSDTYHYGLGDGRDVLIDSYLSSNSYDDRLVFGAGITAQNIAVSRSTRDFDLRIGFSDGNWLTISDGASAYFSEGIETFVFDDGTELSQEALFDFLRSSWTSEAKDDVLGFGTADVISAGGGDDRLSGFGGSDTLTGGAGDDVLIGGEGADTYLYSLGDGNDTILDYYYQSGSDVLIIQPGIQPADVTITRHPLDQNSVYLTFATGAWILLKDQLRLNGGVERIEFDDGTIWLPNDILALADGGQPSSASNQYFEGDASDNTHTFGLSHGHDAFYGSSGTDTLKISNIDPSDIEVGVDEADPNFVVLRVAGTADQISIRDVEYVMFDDGTVWTAAEVHQRYINQNVSGGDDYIDSYASSETIDTGAGDDRIYADNGDDIIRGGVGDDYAEGGEGSDTYIFHLGDGIDTFDGGINDADTVAFGPGIDPSDIEVRLDETNTSFVVLRIAGTTDQVSIRDVEYVSFDNGTVWTIAEVHQRYVDQASTSGDDYIDSYASSETIDAGAGDDRIYADNGDDIIRGGVGDDYAEGGGGSDTYIFHLGDGNDAFDGGINGADTLAFGPGIDPSVIEVRLDETNTSFVVLRIAGTTDQVSIRDVEYVSFDNGTVWTIAEVHQRYVDQASTSGDDYIDSYASSETIDAGAGDDRIYADNGDDIIRGGVGDDYAEGGGGSDTYIFHLGDGNDAFDGGIVGADTLAFGPGIDPSDIEVRLDETNTNFVVLRIAGTTDQVSIRDVEYVSFDNGTVWTIAEVHQRYVDQASTSGDDYIDSYASSETIDAGAGDDRIYADNGDDIIRGGVGDDYAEGGRGSDIYIFHLGDGNDYFDGGIVEADTLAFGPGIDPSDIIVRQDQANSSYLVLEIAGTGDRVSIRDVEWVQFSDGTLVSVSDLVESELLSADGQSTIFGNADDNQLVGTIGDDHLNGRGGSDTLVGGEGADIYEYDQDSGNDIIVDRGSSSDFDALKFGAGILSTDIRVVLSEVDASDLRLVIASTGETITLVGQLDQTGAGIEQVTFEDGTIWGRNDLVPQDIASQTTSGDDLIIGSVFSDVFAGSAGDDILRGGAGADSYLLNIGDGHDLIEDTGGLLSIDKIIFGQGITTGSVSFIRPVGNSSDLLIKYSDEDEVLVKGQFLSDQPAIGQIEFEDGTVLSASDVRALVLSVASTNGDDEIIGFDTDDNLAGGAGDDSLDGGTGSDTYSFDELSGHDVISDNGSSSDLDTLAFGGGITPDSVIVDRSLNGSFTLKSSDGQWSILLAVVPGANAGGLEQISFADGTIWTFADVEQRYYENASTENNGLIYGSDANNNIQGSLNDDTIFGEAGDDNLLGRDGNDILVGGDGDDVLDGGAGDDVLEGGLGLDTYDGGAGVDTITFAYSIAAWIVSLESGTASTIGHPENSETIFNVENIQGSIGNDVLTGNDVSNILSGGAGDDILYGLFGDDTLVGSEGADTLDGGGGSDWVDYQQSDAAVLINLAMGLASGGHADGDTFVGIENVKGSIFDDQLTGDAFDNEIIGNAGADTLVGGLGDDVLEGGAGADNLNGGDGQDWLAYGSSSAAVNINLETAYASGGDAQGDSYSNIENVEGSQFADALTGNSGNNWIRGEGGNDTLQGGAGDDQLEGGVGDDLYIFDLGDGQDLINDGGEDTSAEIDTLELGPGIVPGDVVLTATGPDGDVILTITNTNDQITLKNQLTGFAGGVDRIEFADGTVWDRSAIDILANGGSLNNVPLAVDDGVLTAVQDTALIISPSTLSANDSDPDGDVLTVYSVQNAVNGAVSINQDGNVIFTPAAGYTGGASFEYTITDGEAFASATVNISVTSLQEIADYVGTAGNDTYNGTSADEIIIGLSGDDSLNGKGGSDTYIYDFGDGDDTITEDYNSGSADRLELGAGILIGEVTFVRGTSDFDDLTLQFIDGGSVTLNEQFYYNIDYGIEEIAFADGTIWDDAMIRSVTLAQSITAGDDTVTGYEDTDDTLEAGLGDDTLNGLDGSDTYIYNLGDGNDTITDGYRDGIADRLELGAGILTSEVTVVRSTSDLDDVTLQFIDGGSVRLDEQFYGDLERGVEEVAFADGTVWDVTVLRSLALAQSITSGDDAIYGYETTADTLEGGTGNDVLNGLDGSDTYIYNIGDGNDTITDGYRDGIADRLEVGAGILTSEVTVVRSTSDLDDVTLQFIDGGSVRLDEQFYGDLERGVEEVAFADGTVWDVTVLRSLALAQSITSGDDAIYGYETTADTLEGGTGNDVLNGLDGSDTYVYSFGDGNDTIIDTYYDGAADRVSLGSNILLEEVTLSQITSDDDDVVLHFADGGSITLDEQFGGYLEQGVEEIEFADGTIWDIATLSSLAQQSATTSGDDVVDAGAGNDWILGGAGDDTFIFKSGDGNDTIADFTAGAASDDVIEFQGLAGFSDYNDVLAAATQDVDDVVITIDPTNSVTLKDIQLSALHADDFRFVA